MSDTVDNTLPAEGEEPTMVDLTLTCTTEGCGNAGVPITLTVPDTVTAAQCGACGEPITMGRE